MMRPGDFAARYGGEEFVVILPETDLHGALIVAEKIRLDIEGLAMPHEDSKAAPVVTVSLGVAAVDLGGVKNMDIEKSVTQLIEASDRALYKAKGQGRNTVVYEELNLKEGNKDG